MKVYRFAWLLLLLVGCAALHEQQSTKPQDIARVAVDEANAALTALNRVISSNVKNGVWTKPQAQSFLDTSKEYGKQVDRAREALRLGDFTDAEARAKTVKALIIVLQRKVAEAGRQS